MIFSDMTDTRFREKCCFRKKFFVINISLGLNINFKKETLELKSWVFKLLSFNILSQLIIMPYPIYSFYNYKHLIFIALQLIH